MYGGFVKLIKYFMACYDVLQIESLAFYKLWYAVMKFIILLIEKLFTCELLRQIKFCVQLITEKILCTF